MESRFLLEIAELDKVGSDRRCPGVSLSITVSGANIPAAGKCGCMVVMASRLSTSIDHDHGGRYQCRRDDHRAGHQNAYRKRSLFTMFDCDYVERCWPFFHNPG
ncbi:hypothetical protein [Burkholderia sp. 22PA0106]|uniref:hypothetical protein n=1 Tax=Burkholderia sp. 22PA0106 TaxID=3237371 RepID=UPI0039C33240